jgi:hypothetical protein
MAGNIESRTWSELFKMNHARYYWQMLAESHPMPRLFGSMVRQIEALAVARGEQEGDETAKTRQSRDPGRRRVCGSA